MVKKQKTEECVTSKIMSVENLSSYNQYQFYSHRSPKHLCAKRKGTVIVKCSI